MRRRALCRWACRVYSSDRAFVAAANLAGVMVCVLVVMWLVLALGPRPSAVPGRAGQPAASCIYLLGECW